MYLHEHPLMLIMGKTRHYPFFLTTYWVPPELETHTGSQPVLRFIFISVACDYIPIICKVYEAFCERHIEVRERYPTSKLVPN